MADLVGNSDQFSYVVAHFILTIEVLDRDLQYPITLLNEPLHEKTGFRVSNQD